jgi:hypothetical protein
METNNKKIAGIVFTESGVMIEKPYCEASDELKSQYRIAEDKFTGELLEIAKRVIKARMAHCFKQLHSNLANAKVITPQTIIWKGGHFSVPAWEAMDAVLHLDDVRKLNRFQCQQIVRSMLLNSEHYWLGDYDENWNSIPDSSNVKMTDAFKMFITEHFLVADQAL